MGRAVSSNAKLTHVDPVVLGQTLSWATLVAAVIKGEAFDEGIGMRQVCWFGLFCWSLVWTALDLQFKLFV